MKILIDARPIRTPLSGVAQYTLRLINAFAGRLTASDKLSLLGSNFRGTNSGPLSEIAGNQHVEVFAPQFLPRPLLNISTDILRWPSVNHYALDADLVHETFFASVPCAGRTRRVSTIHDVIPLDRPELFTRKVRWLARRAYEAQVEKSDRIIAVSHYTKQRICELSGVDPNRIEVIPNGVNIVDRISGKLPAAITGKKFVLYVGNIEPRKNLITLAKAMARVVKDYPDHVLAIAGKPCWGYDEQMQVLRGLLGESVVFLGYVSEDAKWSLLKAASLVVYPSEYEGFGIPVLEAMTAGAPVVFAQNSALTELAVCEDQMFPTLNDSRLCERIVSALSGAPWVRASVELGLRKSQDYRWPNVAEQTWQLYRSVLGN